MLSYLYQIMRHFELQHGYPPNLLYLSPAYFQQLQAEMADIPNLDDLTLFLGMQLVLSADHTQPKVVWSAADWQRAIAV